MSIIGLVLLIALAGMVVLSAVIQLKEMAKREYESGKLTATEEASFELRKGGRL